jgi:hypothetical protein
MILAFYLTIAFLAIKFIIAIKTIIVKRAVSLFSSILNLDRRSYTPLTTKPPPRSAFILIDTQTATGLLQTVPSGRAATVS